MLISELAARTGVSARALRHYERSGLLPTTRLSNRYRDFGEDSVERVRRIRLLLHIGLNLAAVRRLMPCFAADGRLTACTQAREHLAAQIRAVDDSITRLHETRALLAAALADADRRTTPSPEEDP